MGTPEQLKTDPRQRTADAGHLTRRTKALILAAVSLGQFMIQMDGMCRS